MKNISIMIKPASSLCNMRCKYCFYADVASLRQEPSYGIMQPQLIDPMLEHIFRDLKTGDSITLAFQGGEPTIAGLDWFREFVEKVKKWSDGIQINYALQTNGFTLDEQWAEFLAKHHFLVGLSMDLLPEQHDRVRIDAQGKGTWKRVKQSLSLLNQFNVEYNVLCTLTNYIARHPSKVWNQIEHLNLSYIQFTPCLDELNTPGKSAYALTPQRFASFYTELFSLWLEHFRNGTYRSIKLFDDLVNLLAWGIPTACGITGTCQPQVIIEADGSVYPCDFYCLDEYCLGNISDTGIMELLQRSAKSPSKLQEPLPDLCGSCPFKKMCNGNCKRMRREICCDNQSSFCGYQEFLKIAINDLSVIANRERQYRQVTERHW